MTNLTELKAASSTLNKVKVRRFLMVKNLADWKQLSKDEKSYRPTLDVHLSERECLDREEQFTKDLEDFDAWIAAKLKVLAEEALKL